ncbi:MAG: type II toxin-antitoxin system VapC family toxin [Candidatus Entotheonellia bacterium]
MTIRYLIDTDWVIDHLHGIERVVNRLKELRSEGLFLSVISLAELYEGVYYSRDPDKSQVALEAFLEDVSVLGVDEEICKRFARERGRLRKEGKLIGDFDLLIGTTGLQHNLTVLTNNRRHFETIEGLQIESL